jgi:hypothetical protein
LYSSGKQTYSELAVRFECSAKTVQREIDSIQIVKYGVFMSIASVIVDTAYFGHTFGMMAFMDSLSGRMPYPDFVKHENPVFI